MFKFLGRGKSKTAASETDSGPSTMPQTVQLDATQVELVRMTLHGVLKLNGIPGNWIDALVLPVQLPGHSKAVLLQLEVLHWHDALVLHAPALQQELLEALQSFDPGADQTHYLFAWKFSAQSGCPHLHLPQPDFWRTSARVLAPTASATALQAVAEWDNSEDGFAPTRLRDDRQ